ncbi:hypothetical protein QU217_004122 [Cronobacter sakazakii]|nr:hypothetical protein [Cronobacter sakazakii]EKY2008835.1 hypothetical protein [Cronobacter sakazakii]
MSKELIVGILLIGLAIYTVGKSFYDNESIEKKGATVTAVVLKAVQISSNETGSINGDFIVKFDIPDAGEKIIRFKSTIPQLYAPRVQPGCEVQVRYLDKGDKVKAYFVFE